MFERKAEEALDRGRVQVDGDHAVDAGRVDELGDHARADRLAARGSPILPRANAE